MYSIWSGPHRGEALVEDQNCPQTQGMLALPGSSELMCPLPPHSLCHRAAVVTMAAQC